MPQTLVAKDVEAIFPEVQEITDGLLREAVIDIWIAIAAEMPWNDLQHVPKDGKEAGRNTFLIDHVKGVTRTALAIAEVAKSVHGKDYDRDMLIAACLLHDASKPVEMEPVPDSARPGKGPLPSRKSILGKNVQHGVYAAFKVIERKLPFELANLIITHTHHSNIRGTTWEAGIIFYADMADTDATRSQQNLKLYAEQWKKD